MSTAMGEMVRAYRVHSGHYRWIGMPGERSHRRHFLPSSGLFVFASFAPGEGGIFGLRENFLCFHSRA